MCNKMIQYSACGIGKTYKSQCKKPIYNDGLCKGHYKRKLEKSMNWKDRKEYQPATQHDLDSGRSMKLRKSNSHKLYRVRKGIIQEFSSKLNKYVDTDVSVDFNLFCVKL